MQHQNRARFPAPERALGIYSIIRAQAKSRCHARPSFRRRSCTTPRLDSEGVFISLFSRSREREYPGRG